MLLLGSIVAYSRFQYHGIRLDLLAALADLDEAGRSTGTATCPHFFRGWRPVDLDVLVDLLSLALLL